MIKNVVFDLGGVLINYAPVSYLRERGCDAARAALIIREIFGADIWGELDRGAYTWGEALEIFAKRTGLSLDEITDLLDGRFLESLAIKPETEAFLDELLRQGYRVYILSNFSKEGFEYVSAKFDFFRRVHGMVISYRVKKIKPEPEIYEILLDKYGLVPGETVFIDDTPKNLDAAELMGFNTILFTDINEVKEKFLELGIVE
jgi:putative hydrolase of the HAD superfamily